jgi:ATP-binding cassette subfamily C (CFTR/MRP) protein 1
VVVSVILLGNLIGVAVWGGAGTLFGILILQILVIGLLASYQKEFLQGGDRRLKLVREVLYGMKIIKFRALENFFTGRINAIRSEQLSVLKKYYAVQAYFVGLIQIAPIAMPIGAFLVYAGNNGSISPGIVFPALALFQGLFQPILTIPQSLTATIVAIVSWKRIVSLLLAEEGEVLNLRIDAATASLDDIAPMTKSVKGPALEANNVSFQWEKVLTRTDGAKVEKDSKRRLPWQKKIKEKEDVESIPSTPEDAFSIQSCSFTVEHGQKVAIVGTVGSGKSSLLSGLINEMPRIAGDFSLNGSLAYCAQQPWILTETIKGNIVFAEKDQDQKKLDRVLTACGLDADIEQFPAGIMTEIGEKGVNLSGGQKARVALARALYNNSDIVLLDDPISALDAQVGRYVFDKAIKEYLAEKTVILVTHQLHLLPEMDYILVLDKGRLVEQGCYKDLMSKGAILSTLMSEYKLDDDKVEKKKEVVKEKHDSKDKGIIVDEEKQRYHMTHSFKEDQ